MLNATSSAVLPRLELTIGPRTQAFRLVPDESLAAGLTRKGIGVITQDGGVATMSGFDPLPWRPAKRQPPVVVEGGATLVAEIEPGSKLTGSGSMLSVLVYDVDRVLVGQHDMALLPGSRQLFLLPEDATSLAISVRLTARSSVERLAVGLTGAAATFARSDPGKADTTARALAGVRPPLPDDGDDVEGRSTRKPVGHSVGSSFSAANRSSAFRQATSVEGSLELLSSVGTSSIDPGKLRGALDLLIKSRPHRVAIARAARDLPSGAEPVSPEQLILAYYGARAFAQLNAYTSASALIDWIEAVGASAQSQVFTPAEQSRLGLLAARVAQRSGRSELSAERYRRAFLVDPANQEALLGHTLALVKPNPALATALLEGKLVRGGDIKANDLVLMSDILLSLDRPGTAATAILAALGGRDKSPEPYLGLANLSAKLGDEAGWLGALKHYGGLTGLSILGRGAEEACAPFAFTTDHQPASVTDTPLVSVIMTCFDAEKTVERAIRSVLAQTVANVEVIVVDDVSNDGSRALLSRIAAAEPRVKLLFNDVNMGTYCAKNRGFDLAEGAFVTFHDSDDWMHPTRIERHLATHPEDAVCTTSRWIRMDDDGHVFVQRTGVFTHLNPASTFVRRESFSEVRGFDTVRTGADSEFVSRLRARYGEIAVVALDDCLGIGLHHQESLTQSGAAAFDEHRYSPVRLAYTEAWVAWHLSQQEQGGSYALQQDGRRSFTAPEVIAVTLP